ncbi:MAG: transglutaminase domain-containing protein [Candidatus Curtissbacteria bacterium]|nr:transglutaminase domain-containing protein [Candidatus Curtissbacteria bacterium]
MRFLVRFCLAAFVLLSLITVHYALFTPVTHAAGEFGTTYKVEYDVDETGKTQVTQQIVLKNKTSNYYADKFELKIGSTKVENVKAQDATGPLETEAKFENNLTTISVKFNQKVIGIEKTLPWTLTYTSGELASKSGQIWEVSIPRLARSADITDYSAAVSTPISFGQIAFAVPSPLTSEKVGIRQSFTFGKDQLVESGIAISFGEKQVFSFTLNYHLENNNLTSQMREIALPPDNNYQKIVIQKLDPAPRDVIVDKDNNFLALYKLSSHQKIDVTATGFVEVFSRPFRNIYSPLGQSDRELYTTKQKYWETDSAFIKKKAQELKNPQAIYNFVTTYLSYNEDRLKQTRVERKGAAAAAASPNDAICTEFTDLFIAIARAAGIPAREVEGYAYTQNERLRPLSLALFPGDVLHAWPEYWDDKLGWVQVDPTWGSTSGGLDYFKKLDFNHITFVQRGVSSQTPYPAGSYKRSGDLGKDIAIEFAQDLPTPSVIPELSLSAPQKIISGIPVSVIARLENAGNTSIFGKSLTLTSYTLRRITDIAKPQPTDNSVEIALLPPYAKRSFQFRLTNPAIFGSSNDTLTLSYAGTQIALPVSAFPIYNLIFLKSFLVSMLITVLIIAAGLILYKKTARSRKKYHL